MQMCFAINIAQQHSRLYGHSPQFRFNGHCVHNREIGDDAIITQVRPATTFYKAEEYHQDYYKNNPQQGYCSFVVAPKLKKFREKFAEKRRKSA